MLETGKSYTQEIIVGPKDTALAHGSGHLEVFATPAMVGLMENTAIHCLEAAGNFGTGYRYRRY